MDVERTEAQYLVINALQTLELLTGEFYDEETGIWYIETPSQILPIARLMSDGEILSLEAS
jgi:hypothetical protein